MLASELKDLFSRDLDRLMHELESYESEDVIWEKVGKISNSAGNLFMHLCGNLQHFIGAVLAKTGYERKRDFEFNGKVSMEELKLEIEKTKQTLQAYFETAEDSTFSEEYPLQPFGHAMTISYFLIHLQGHLNYHMGQINYHRRILSKTSK
ncbi:MAG: DinB family protein [Ekhidna sp.]